MVLQQQTCGARDQKSLWAVDTWFRPGIRRQAGGELKMRFAAILVVSGVLAGCAVEPPPLVADSSVPALATGPVAYRPVVDGYVSRRPGDPEDWRERNRQVAPNGDDQ